MKHCFILNPAAGKTDRTAELRKKITALCEARGLDYAIAVSRAPGQCETLAREMAQRGEPCRIYACGGDGTLNEVVNGAAGFPNCAVTHYPMGSGNDFIKASSDPAAFGDLEKLLDPDERVFDLIQVNDRLGIDICSIGIDARIGTDVGKYKRIPLLSGVGRKVVSVVLDVYGELVASEDESAHRDLWTESQLRSALDAYKDIAELEASKSRFDVNDSICALSQETGRRFSYCHLRLANIAWLLQGKGRTPIACIAPSSEMPQETCELLDRLCMAHPVAK